MTITLFKSVELYTEEEMLDLMSWQLDVTVDEVKQMLKDKDLTYAHELLNDSFAQQVFEDEWNALNDYFEGNGMMVLVGTNKTWRGISNVFKAVDGDDFTNTFGDLAGKYDYFKIILKRGKKDRVFVQLHDHDGGAYLELRRVKDQYQNKSIDELEEMSFAKNKYAYTVNPKVDM